MTDDTVIFDPSELVEEPQLYDMSQEVPTLHRFEQIIGNELRCNLHDGDCPVIRIRPTEVLERNKEGELVLVDKLLG